MLSTHQYQGVQPQSMFYYSDIFICLVPSVEITAGGNIYFHIVIYNHSSMICTKGYLLCSALVINLGSPFFDFVHHTYIRGQGRRNVCQRDLWQSKFMISTLSSYLNAIKILCFYTTSTAFAA